MVMLPKENNASDLGRRKFIFGQTSEFEQTSEASGEKVTLRHEELNMT